MAAALRGWLPPDGDPVAGGRAHGDRDGGGTAGAGRRGGGGAGGTDPRRSGGGVLDAWVAEVAKDDPMPTTRVRDLPGRSDALVLHAACPTGRYMATVKYTAVKGELVFDAPSGDWVGLGGRLDVFALVQWPVDAT
jgi:hypothetical protein